MSHPADREQSVNASACLYWTPSLHNVELEGVTKVYEGNITALDSIDLRIEPGERLTVLGPSGSGKSTLLRIIAGLELPSSGCVRIGGVDQRDVPPHRREVSMIFQQPALLPHLSVFENIAFGIRARRSDKEVPTAVAEAARILGLTPLLKRRPAALSGGERQRVALGRALASKPRILLLDEPFSSLDAPLRAALQEELVDLHRRLGMTLVHVTHDQGEALSIGERIAVLDAGQILQCGPPREIYERPKHRQISQFIGTPPMNLIPCEIRRDEDHFHVLLASRDGRPSIGTIEASGHPLSEMILPGQTRRIDLGIRPESIALFAGLEKGTSRNGETSAEWFPMRLEFRGHESWLHAETHGISLVVRMPGNSPEVQDSRIRLAFDLTRATWFDPEKGHALTLQENPFAQVHQG